MCHYINGHYIKPIARVYTRECHENKNTRFWATYGYICKQYAAARACSAQNFPTFLGRLWFCLSVHETMKYSTFRYDTFEVENWL